MKTTFGDSYSIESVKKMLNLKELNFFKTERFYNLSDGTTTDVPVLMCRAEDTEENELPTVKTKSGRTIVPLRLSYEVAMDAKAFKAKEENKGKKYSPSRPLQVVVIDVIDDEGEIISSYSSICFGGTPTLTL